VPGQERLAGSRVEDDVDVGVAGRPGVAQEAGGTGFEAGTQAVAQPVQRRAQRCTPGLVPLRLALAAAAAVAAPALDAVSAAPGRVLRDLDFGDRRVLAISPKRWWWP
jgi:hypothetical protein